MLSPFRIAPDFARGFLGCVHDVAHLPDHAKQHCLVYLFTSGLPQALTRCRCSHSVTAGWDKVR